MLMMNTCRTLSPSPRLRGLRGATGTMPAGRDRRERASLPWGSRAPPPTCPSPGRQLMLRPDRGLAGSTDATPPLALPPTWSLTTSTACSGAGVRACCSSLPDLGFAGLPAAPTWNPTSGSSVDGALPPTRVPCKGLLLAGSETASPRSRAPSPLCSASLPRQTRASGTRRRPRPRSAGARRRRACRALRFAPSPGVSTGAAAEPPAAISDWRRHPSRPTGVAPRERCRMARDGPLGPPTPKRGRSCSRASARPDHSGWSSHRVVPPPATIHSDRRDGQPTSGPCSASESGPSECRCQHTRGPFLSWALFPSEASLHRTAGHPRLRRARSHDLLPSEPSREASTRGPAASVRGGGASPHECGPGPPWGFSTSKSD